ncbi:MAG: DUF5615 family PIN-like protein [Thermoanaerobaculia bacterium]
MRLLLDESLPRNLGRELAPHAVRTVAQMGWAGIANGALLRRASAEGFDALLTADQNLEYQQNLPEAAIAVVVLVAKANRISHLLPLVPALLRALATVRSGEVIRVPPP